MSRDSEHVRNREIPTFHPRVAGTGIGELMNRVEETWGIGPDDQEWFDEGGELTEDDALDENPFGGIFFLKYV